MVIPIPQSRYAPARDFNNPLPPICDDDGYRSFGDSHRSAGFPDPLSPSSASRPMSIQNRQSQVDAPPPLPPPRFVPILGPLDPQYQNKDHFGRERNLDSPSGDSFELSFSRRPFLPSRPDDEGYQSYESTRSPLDYPSPIGSQTYQKFRPSNAGIDSSMINKLNGARKLNNRSPPRRSGLSMSLNEAPSARANHSQLAPISLPHRTKQGFLDSPSGFTNSPVLLSAVSPRSGPFHYAPPEPADYRSPAGTDTSELERSPIPRSRRTNSGSVPDDATVSTQGSFEMARDDEPDFPMDETSRLRSLNIEDQWREREREFYQSGQKRRASSPPCDDGPMASDQLRRRDGGMLSRGSPTPRLSVIPQGSSLSSLSSAGRSGSYATASSMTSMNSFGRRSPTGLSQGAMSPADPSSPYATPISLTTSPRSSIGGRSAIMAQPQPHQRTLSIEQAIAAAAHSSRGSQRKVELPRNSVVAKLKGPYMCDCCPKKPKKFESEEELNAHTAEKQYECSYCGNRFKNKNEMERHQNSLHVRRHSWSCSALTGYERAFHDSTATPGEADTCGYCGRDFERTGPAGDQNGRFITDRDLEERIVHLQEDHKFRECNASKKFYRADHFRQHLKHSHAGTSGKWTNMLENACMMEEEAPIPMSK